MSSSELIVDYIAYAIFATLSIIAGCLVILTHLSLPRLLKHPGSIIIGHCVSHLLLDIHWYTGIPVVHNYLLENGLCYALGCFGVYAYLTSWNYITILSVEIMIKTIYPSNTVYKKRMILMHLFANLLGIIFMIIVISVGSPGISVLDTCFIEKGTKGENVFLPLMVVHTPVMALSLIVSIRKAYFSGRNLLINHTLVVIVFWTTAAPTVFSHMLLGLIRESFLELKIVRYKQLSIFLGSISGLLIAMARLLNKKLLNELYFVLFKRRSDPVFIREEVKTTHDNNLRMPIFERELLSTKVRENVYYNEIYDNITIYSMIEILSILTLRFKLEPHADNLYAIEYLTNSENSFYDSLRKTYNLGSLKDHDETLGTVCSNFRHKSIKIREYAPGAFNNIRYILGYTDSILAEYLLLRSLSPASNQSRVNSDRNNSGGRSNAFFFTDHSEKIVIKSISRSERKYFIKHMLRYYYKRITSSPNSMLNRILGIFEFEASNTHIMLLENIIPNKDAAYLFDLKGSTFQRSTLKNSSDVCTGKVMKDLDFKNLDIHLKISEESQIELLNTLRDDVRLLEELGIMDYSLLVGVYDNSLIASSRYTIISENSMAFNIAIIDFLQRYNLTKKAEREVKRILSNEDISSISPRKYSERFLSFIQKTLLSSWKDFHFAMSL